MRGLFSGMLNMSMTGSIVILLVMLARLLLKRTPKIFSYALWAVVLFRLLCPVAFTAPVSVLEAFQPEVKEASDYTSTVSYLPGKPAQGQVLPFVPAENLSGNLPEEAEPVRRSEWDVMRAASWVWIAGAAAMLLYSAVQYVCLRRRLIGAVVYRGNVYLADYLDTPFVMGILRPKIYLPSNVPAEEQKYIIAHERHHIRRFDHIIKLLAYFTLCVHWFNPLVWTAFILAGKDMEMSCDEAVIKRMGSQIRADYSESLLRLATHKKIIAGMPLAFGEGDTKGRVMNMKKWKKPRLRVSLICMLLCAAVLAACAVNPETSGAISGRNTAKTMDEDASAKALNIREKPKSTSAVVGNYPSGTTVTILETQNGWGRTDRGWIFMDYVTMTDGSTGIVTPQNGETGAYSPTVSGSDIGTDTRPVQYGTLKMLLPSDFTAENADDTVVLTIDSVAVGGIRHWNYPEFHPSDIVEWMKEENGEPIGYMSGSSAYGDAEFEIFRDGNPDALNQKHVFFIDGDTIYDVWYDQNLISDGIAERFLKTAAINAEPDAEANPAEQLPLVASDELEPVVDGSHIITDTELVQYGTLKMLLSAGLAAREQDGAVVLTKDSVDVGGITCYSTPEFELKIDENMSDWVSALGLPEGKMNLDGPISQMIGSTLHGDLETEFFYDMDPSVLNTEHHFYIDGKLVYDVWYDQNLISDGIAERFLKTVAINADPVIEANPAEQAAFEKCRAVIEAVQSGTCHIAAEQSGAGDSESHWSTANYYQDNGNWLKIVDVDPEPVNIVDGEQYSLRMAFMAANDAHYSNEGNWGKAYTDIDWREDNLTFNDSVKPWLASFQWGDAVAYMDTLTDENGECVMLRVDEAYKDSDEYDPHYFVYFNFDPDGNFVSAYLQVNLFRDNGFTITESIVSMDPETVSGEIQREYQRAVV